jgi:hypothetical protein
MDCSLFFVLGECLLEPVESAPMLFDLFVEERYGLPSVEEPKKKDAEDRLVADRAVGAGLAKPMLDLLQALARDRVGLAPTRSFSADMDEPLSLERRERRAKVARSQSSVATAAERRSRDGNDAGANSAAPSRAAVATGRTSDRIPEPEVSGDSTLSLSRNDRDSGSFSRVPGRPALGLATRGE